jgi:uncharacterized membrane protein
MALNALRSEGIDIRQIRPIQGSFFVSPQNEKPKSVAPPCRFTVATPEPTAGYTLRELTSDKWGLTQGLAISENGIIAGTSLAQGERSQDMPWIQRDNETVFIDCAGSAHSVNNAGQVTVSGMSTDGKFHAGLYTPDQRLLDLHDAFAPTPTFTATSSQALTINENGLVGGSVEDRSGKHGEKEPNIRAFYTESGGSPVTVMEPAAMRYCRAVDVNQDGTLLIMASKNIMDSITRSALWNRDDNKFSYIGYDAGLSVYPIAITDSGTVLGQAKNHRGQPITVVCTSGGNWQRLGTEDGWAPADINGNGDIIGTAQIEGILRPWLYLSSGKMVMLPYVISHNTRPHAINNQGQIVGSAYSDHGYHAVLWEILR